MRRIIIAGIGTDVGKTIVAAIFVKALSADYWKPIQCGNLESCDTSTLRNLASDPAVVFHKEAYRLKHPISPHIAAPLEDIKIDVNQINPPSTDNHLVIECAGGLLVPLNDTVLQLDAYQRWDCEWYLVSKHYLGSINHTLLSIEALKHRHINLKGIVFNGHSNPTTEQAIKQQAGDILYLHLNEEGTINSTTINQYAKLWKQHLIKV